MQNCKRNKPVIQCFDVFKQYLKVYQSLKCLNVLGAKGYGLLSAAGMIISTYTKLTQHTLEFYNNSCCIQHSILGIHH